MESIYIRIIEKIFIVYFLGYFLIDIFLFILFVYAFRSDKKKYEVSIELNEFFRKVSVIVPAYNEHVSIVNCIRMLQKMDYPDFEILVVNDGSSDKTVDTLLNSFEFKPDNQVKEKILRCTDVKNVYRCGADLVLIDKYNGGKADAINAGINFSSGEFICTVDADSILDENSLRRVVMPMIMDKRVFVTGGQLAISNDTIIRDNKIVNFKMPDNIWVIWQITEYMKSFLVSRMGLSKINSLLIMSGAFSVYRKEDLINTGGFLTSVNDHHYIKKIFKSPKSTVCEDMEIVVRLWRYYHENRKPARAVYLAKPLCWTEVPDNSGNLFKQRSRWHLGLAECLSMHGKMMFDPKYWSTGLFAFPYYLFFELLAPLMKILALIFIIYASLLGVINSTWVLLMALFITFSTALITSMITIILEKWSQKQAVRNLDALRYKTFGDWFKLLFSSIAGDFSYSFFKIFSQLKGLLDFVREKSEWNKFERKGIRHIATAPSEIN